MKKKDLQELRKLDLKELSKKIPELKKELINLNLEKGIQKLKNTRRIFQRKTLGAS